MDKKFINEVEHCVDDSINGYTRAFPGLHYHQQFRFVTKKELKTTNKVAVISGGGSGHEPFCTGYVGDGMLAAAVAGNIFASPPKTHILQAITFLNQFYKGGILVIIPNYTGDCLNFGMAIETARNFNINVESVIVADDEASGQNSIAGRRGMCGLLFAYKIAGALAELGDSLSSIVMHLKKLLKNVATLGISSKPCSLPGQEPLFTINKDEMELGTGVHGEAGIVKLKFSTAKDAVRIILDKLVEFKGTKSSSLVVLINNLGSTTELEQNIICHEVYTQLTSRNIFIERMYPGMLMTSLDMAGFQISILHLTEDMKKNWLELLDHETNSPRWVATEMSKSCQSDIKFEYVDLSGEVEENTSNNKFRLSKEEAELLKTCLLSVAGSLIANECKLNDLDSGCGDGDCGTTLKNFAEGLKDITLKHSFDSPATLLKSLSDIAESRMGGTSGAIYSLCFSSMRNLWIKSTIEPVSQIWGKALYHGLESIKEYGHAKLGDRTIIDSMEPAITAYNKSILLNDEVKSALVTALISAKDGCEQTKDMNARAGRASYVNKEHLTDVDAGALGFVICLEAIVNQFNKI